MSTSAAKKRVVEGVATGRAVHEFEDEAAAPMTKPVSSELIAPCAVQPRPQNSQDEAGRNGRADVSLHALQINVELAADQVDERHPGEPSTTITPVITRPKPTSWLLGRVRLDLLIEVERDQGGSRIEHRTHRSHQRRQQGRDHHAHQAGRKQIDDQSWDRRCRRSALRRADRT